METTYLKFKTTQMNKFIVIDWFFLTQNVLLFFSDSVALEQQLLQVKLCYCNLLATKIIHSLNLSKDSLKLVHQPQDLSNCSKDLTDLRYLDYTSQPRYVQVFNAEYSSIGIRLLINFLKVMS